MMKIEELSQELYRRSVLNSQGLTREFCNALAGLIHDNDIRLTLEDFTPHGVRMVDLNGRYIGVYHCVTENGYFRSDTPLFTEVVIVETSGMLLGWVLADKVSESGKGFAGGTKSLFPMPKEFRFSQPCPHMSEYGGVWHQDQKSWECFGCGTYLPDLLS